MELADEAMAQLLEVNDALQAAQARWKDTATRAAEATSHQVSQSASATSLPRPDRAASASSNDAWAAPVTLPPPRPQQQQQQQQRSSVHMHEQHAAPPWQSPFEHGFWQEQQQQHAGGSLPVSQRPPSDRPSMSFERQQHHREHESRPLVDLQSYTASDLAPASAQSATDVRSVASQASSSASMPVPGMTGAQLFSWLSHYRHLHDASCICLIVTQPHAWSCVAVM